MKTVCPPNHCTGCRVCEAKCPKRAIKLIDTLDIVQAEIDETTCIKCGLCEKVCPNHNPIKKENPIKWYQGWAIDQELRSTSSSGGIAAAITKSFINQGGYACSCVFEKGEFSFIITNNTAEAKRFAGSKYVKTSPYNAYEEVHRHLTENNKVLFIGLPCQVAALKNYVPKTKQKNLYCVDLICHGTPSQELFNIYLKQHNVKIEQLENISFRSKGKMGLDIEAIAPSGTVDRYLISFLNSLNYTEGCYNCIYACSQRVSDITLGDNWGTDLPEELSKGISLILCMTPKGEELINLAHLNIMSVNKDKALSENGQLTHPSQKPEGRDRFFKKIKIGANYDKTVFILYPRQCLRQILKGLAIKLKLYKPGGIG